MLNTFIHDKASVETDSIGENTKVWQHTVILKGATIGKNCNINSHCFIENEVTIGSNVTIKCGAYLWDGLVIEDNVFIGPNVTFTNDIYPRSKKYPESFVKTFIRKGVSIGAGSTILAGITIGEYAMIGIGSVITKNIPPYTLWYGNPGKMMGYVTDEGEVLDLNFYSRTGKKYKIQNGRIVADESQE